MNGSRNCKTCPQQARQVQAWVLFALLSVSRLEFWPCLSVDLLETLHW